MTNEDAAITNDLADRAKNLRRFAKFAIARGDRTTVVELDLLEAVLSGDVAVDGYAFSPRQLAGRLHKANQEIARLQSKIDSIRNCCFSSEGTP